MVPQPHKEVYIQSYKHDGSLHRTWDQGYVLESDEEHYVVVTNKTWVIESDGRRWYTREPAICFFYTERWYNAIAMIREDGIYYYCNLASPALYDGEAIKYIDYDIDYKIFTDKTMLTLDLDEYQLHKKQMHYSNRLDFILKYELANLIEMVRERELPFDKNIINKYYDKYVSLVSKQ